MFGRVRAFLVAGESSEESLDGDLSLVVVVDGANRASTSGALLSGARTSELVVELSSLVWSTVVGSWLEEAGSGSSGAPSVGSLVGAPRCALAAWMACTAPSTPAFRPAQRL